MFDNKDFQQLLAYKKLIIVLLLIGYAIGAYHIYTKHSNRYSKFFIEYSFYVSNQNIFKAEGVLPNTLGGTLVYNTEVHRILAYTAHPFLLDSLQQQGRFQLEKLFKAEIEEMGALDLAFYTSLKMNNKNTSPNIQLAFRLPGDRKTASALADEVVRLIVNRYNSDLINELQQQLRYVEEGAEKDRMKVALAIFAHRKPIVVGRKIRHYYSYSEDQLRTHVCSYLFVVPALIWVLILCLAQKQKMHKID